MDVSEIISTNIDTNSEDITIIVSVFSRPKYFERLIEEIDKVKYNSIWISCWHSPNYEIFKQKYDVIRKKTNNKLYFFSSNYQLKYFGRFQLAFQVQIKYTLILDDDCIIQPNFYELCIKMINIPEYNGLLGVKGWIFPENNNNLLGSYGDGKFFYPKPIWKRENETKNAFEIDIVGGAWFFRTEWILHLFKEFPYTFETGEDFHFSYMLHKYANIKTFFIPNDNNYKNYWGCSVDFSSIDMDGNSRNSDMGTLRKKIFWKQYLCMCPFVNRVKKNINNFLIVTNSHEYNLSKFIKNYNEYLILILSNDDIDIDKNYSHEDEIFTLNNKLTQKYPIKLNCLILNGYLQNGKNNIQTYLEIIAKMFNNLFNFNDIQVFENNEIIQYFNILNKNIIIYDKTTLINQF